MMAAKSEYAVLHKREYHGYFPKLSARLNRLEAYCKAAMKKLDLHLTTAARDEMVKGAAFKHHYPFARLIIGPHNCEDLTSYFGELLRYQRINQILWHDGALSLKDVYNFTLRDLDFRNLVAKYLGKKSKKLENCFNVSKIDIIADPRSDILMSEKIKLKSVVEQAMINTTGNI
jgi:hypothetical protein